MVARRNMRLRSAGPYRLSTAVQGHGWYDLAPHDWDAGRARLRTAIAQGDEAVDVEASEGEDGAALVRIAAHSALGRAGGAAIEKTLRRMLRLDVRLDAFWDECARHPRLGWVPVARAGHLMQSATWFEDLLKILFTTNCSWAATRSMCQRLVDALGPVAPSGRRAFPTAARCAAQPETFWRGVVRAGYRARSCIELSRMFAEAAIEEPSGAELDDVDALRRRLLALPGFGPYAVGHALRGLGHYEDLAIDSWCRAKMRTILGRRKPPSDAWFQREYRRFGRFAGLALWMDLTADWHRPAGAAEAERAPA